jgi:hypothetical protein
MGSKVAGIAVIVVLLAGLGDLLAHPSGTQTLLNGTNSIETTTLQGASGAYA